MSAPQRSNDEPKSQPGSHRRALLTALRRFDLREAWWTLLDAWESRRALRRLAYCTGAILVAASLFWFVFYPRWMQRNSLRMARQWIDAGELNYAAETVQKALARDQKQPELWSLAAELARLNSQKELEVEYARRAAHAAPGDPKYTLEWASAALRAQLHDIAEQALAEMPADALARSSLAQRMLGEMRRRESNLPAARVHFEAALKIDGSGAVNEIPLGLCLLVEREPANRQRGRELLTRWIADPEWGGTALRFLLDDALRQDDRPAVLQHSLALLAHPRCTFGDVPVCLQGLALVDMEKFGEKLAGLKQRHRASPESAAQLVGWLNQIGRHTEALAWMQTLTDLPLARPPLAQAKAESLRAAGDWPALQAWTDAGDWGAELDFIRWAYGLKAARMLGDTTRAEELWRTLQAHALGHSGHALFAGSAIYLWGLTEEAVALWWHAAGQSGGVSYEALGTLARHYQVQRDADGQCKVFTQLYSLRPKDDAVANNFVFFTVLTGKREQRAERLARELAERHPNHPTYTSTYAYVLVAANRATEALRLTEPLAEKFPGSSAVRFAHGLALAATGQKEKARPLLESLPPESLTTREVEMIGALLGGER